MALISSFVVVALAEMGDKTQLIALPLGLRYQRPWTVMLVFDVGVLPILQPVELLPLVFWGLARIEPDARRTSDDPRRRSPGESP